MSVVLNGSTQYLATTTLYDTYPFSVCGWFKQDNDTGSYALASYDKFGGTTDAHLMQSAGSLAGDPVRAMTYVSSWAVAATTTGFSASTWHHFVAVYNSIADRRVYIDGGSKGTDASSRNLTGCINFLIGARAGSSPTSHFAGKLAEFGVYDKALSDAEAVSLANGTNKPSDVASGNLVYYWPLLEDANDDQSTNHLTEYNSPTYSSGDHPLETGIVEAAVAIAAVSTVAGSAEISEYLDAVVAIAGVASVDAAAILVDNIKGSYDTTNTKRRLIAVGNNRLFYEDV